MELPVLQRQLVETLLKRFCEDRVPPHVRDQVRLSFDIRGNNVTLYEERVGFFSPEKWLKMRIAQFRYDSNQNTWDLWRAGRNNKWIPYTDVNANKDLSVLLAEVEQDPRAVFWG